MNLLSLLISLIVLVFSAILHEIAHGFVAERFGDPTPRLMGRLTLDPRPHIDPLMTIAIPLLLVISGSPVVFGGAKPVPVDPFNFRDGRKDLAIVSIAGPVTNLILAILGVLGIHTLIFVHQQPSMINDILYIIININLSLAFFNLLPIPPLDGSKLFSLLLPEREAVSYMAMGNIGFLIIFFLLAFPIDGFSLGMLLNNLILFTKSLLGV